MFSYLLACFVATVIASVPNPHSYDMLEHRAPLTICQVSIGEVESLREDGRMEGHDQFGYIAYPGDYEIGKTALTIFVMNPTNNDFDDILWRWDVGQW